MAGNKMNSRGASLVEALVATLIMTIGVLLLTSGFVATANMMEHSRQQERTGQLTAAFANGGIGGGATMTEQPVGNVTIKVGNLELVVAGGKLQQYSSDEDESVNFFLYLPPTP